MPRAPQDFTRPQREPLPFKIDDDVFYCAPAPPFGALEDVMAIVANHDPEHPLQVTVDDLGHLTGFLDTVLMPESAERFAERLRDPANPITDEHITDVVVWLIQEYGNRPTRPPLSSSNGHGGSGMNSTDGVPLAESIPEISLSNASST